MDGAVVRKLTTILAADAEGYSRLMAADEVSTCRPCATAAPCSAA